MRAFAALARPRRDFCHRWPTREGWYPLRPVQRLLVITAAFALVACKPVAAGGGSSAPMAEAYDKPSDFAGEWVGESNGVLGALKIRSLGPGRYYGQFAGDDGQTRFVCNMQQPLVAPVEDAEPLLGNLVRFTWQDGRGGRGDGWVLINPEDSALTGEIRVGNQGHAMDFVRVDEG